MTTETIHAWDTADIKEIYEKLEKNNFDYSCLTYKEFTVYWANGSPIKGCASDSCLLTEEETEVNRRDKINILIDRLKWETAERLLLIKEIEEAIYTLDIDKIDQLNEKHYNMTTIYKPIFKGE